MLIFIITIKIINIVVGFHNAPTLALVLDWIVANYILKIGSFIASLIKDSLSFSSCNYYSCKSFSIARAIIPLCFGASFEKVTV